MQKEQEGQETNPIAGFVVRNPQKVTSINRSGLFGERVSS